MSLTDKVKNLIADGKTQQAVDMLQAFLKERSTDTVLLNQTFLLEGQYKDLQKRVQLGIEDASAEINRINYSLLNLCDEAENLMTEAEKGSSKTKNTEGSENASMNPLVVFSIIVALAILTIIGILLLSKGDAKTSIRQATETQPAQNK
jgi:Effector-associated domain 11